MHTTLPQIEGGSTRDFVVTYSSTPSTPVLTVFAGSGEGTAIYSATAVASSAYEFHAPYTVPNSRGFYSYTFTCSFTQGPVITPGQFQVVKTTPARY